MIALAGGGGTSPIDRDQGSSGVAPGLELAWFMITVSGGVGTPPIDRDHEKMGGFLVLPACRMTHFVDEP